MNWISLFGLDAYKERIAACMTEGGQGVRDRFQLATLELIQEKKRLQTLLVLAAAVLAVGTIAMLLLSLAVLVHFWDTPQRTVVTWVIAGVWFFAWVVVVYALLAALRQKRPFLALTRAELHRDWHEVQDWKNRRSTP